MEDLKKSLEDYLKDKLPASTIEVVKSYMDLAHTQGEMDNLLQRMSKPMEVELDQTDVEINELEDISHWVNQAHERSEGMER